MSHGQIPIPAGQQGPIGPQGIAGTTGVQGDQGIQGTQGLQGGQGATGQTGDDGDVGAAGVQGDPGSQGIQGVIGNTGPQGIQGIQGDQGVQGVPGTDAFASIWDSITYVADSTLFIKQKSTPAVVVDSFTIQNQDVRFIVEGTLLIMSIDITVRVNWTGGTPPYFYLEIDIPNAKTLSANVRSLMTSIYLNASSTWIQGVTYRDDVEDGEDAPGVPDEIFGATSGAVLRTLLLLGEVTVSTNDVRYTGQINLPISP